MSERKDTAWAKRLVQSRLLHFAAICAVTFYFAPRIEDPRKLTLTEGDVRAIWRDHALRHSESNLSAPQKQQVLDRFVEDELLFREGRRLGLDRDDGIVRSRVIQKMRLRADEAAAAKRPTNEENLRAFFDRTQASWVRESEVKIQHVFVPFGPSADGAEVAAKLLGQRLTREPQLDPATLGTAPFATTRLREWNKSSDLAPDFGPRIAERAPDLPVGSWSEPMRSAFGFHLIRVQERRGGRPATFEEVRQAVRIDFEMERKILAIAELRSALRGSYSVVQDVPAGEQIALLPPKNQNLHVKMAP